MSKLESPSKSLSPANSEQSPFSEPRTPERWWHWGSESPKHADYFQSSVMNQKRNRKQSRRFPEPELYSGEADADARKRMRPLESHYNNRNSRGQVLPDSGSKARVGFSEMDENSRTMNEIGEGVETFESGTASPVAQINVEDESASNSESSLGKRIQLMKMELELVRKHHDKKILTLEKNTRHLQEENFALCETLHWYKGQYEARGGGSSPLDEVKTLRAELGRKNMEIEEKIRQNSSLEEQINTAEGLSGILKDSQAANNVSMRISEDLSELETASAIERISKSHAQLIRSKPILI
ncbi:hypothetical protein N7493_009430 [Penicillium malachiteum]|uniref:Uncharacterized protein n=1 Tax=Penicillium malachiteum TaxID=1324776 RepID=A0AAD6MSD4_9EURO|nr:hypothetical protein N7493_009430 [Penicillium malachiteum]